LVEVQVPISFQGLAPPGLPLADSLHLSLASPGAVSSNDSFVTLSLAGPRVEQELPSE
jgi:hypothetical protein